MRRLRLLFGYGLVALLPIVASADADSSFRKGIAAADLKNYEESARWLRQAMSEDPDESERKVLISGVFFEAYLPHYHLGRVLRLIGDHRCDEALDAWAESERQGVIRGFARMAAELDSSKSSCLAAVLPARLEAAQGSIDSATEAARQVSEPLSASSDETERRAALAQIELATRRLQEARRNTDGVVAGEAKSLAEEAEGRLQKLAEKSVEERARRLSAAAAASRQALADAQQARRSLAARLEAPALVAARRENSAAYPALAVPAGAVSSLADLQRQFDVAEDIEAHRKIESEAKTLGARLGEIDQRVLTTLAELQAPARQSLPSQPAAEISAPSRTEGQGTTSTSRGAIRNSGLESRTESQTESPTESPTESRTESPAIDAQLRSLLTAAEALLGRLDDTRGGLLEAQRGRLLELVESARAEPDSLPKRRRLASSYAALQVIAGGDALFGGRAAEALEILSSRTLPGDTVGAQGLFLRAVALFRLSRVDDQRSANLLERATRDLSRFRALNAGEPPRDVRAFSSDFWRFFDEILGPNGSRR